MINSIWNTNSQSFSCFQNLKVCRTMFDFWGHALLNGAINVYDTLNGAFDHRALLVKVKGTMHKMTENDNRASMHGCVSCIIPPSLPPLRATARHLPAFSVPGVGHLQILCCPGICQPRGHSRAFDTHAVSYQNITTQRILLCMPLRREVLIRIIVLLQRKKLIETTSGTLKCLKRHYSTVRSMKNVAVLTRHEYCLLCLFWQTQQGI